MLFNHVQLDAKHNIFIPASELFAVVSLCAICKRYTKHYLFLKVVRVIILFIEFALKHSSFMNLQ